MIAATAALIALSGPAVVGPPPPPPSLENDGTALLWAFGAVVGVVLLGRLAARVLAPPRLSKRQSQRRVRELRRQGYKVRYVGLPSGDTAVVKERA